MTSDVVHTSAPAEYTEVETGKGADALDRRPQLAAALSAARSARCSVLVSKLDRLSRDVAFVSGLMAHASRSSWPSWAETPTPNGVRLPVLSIQKNILLIFQPLPHS